MKPPRKGTLLKRPPIWVYNGPNANIAWAVMAHKKDDGDETALPSSAKHRHVLKVILHAQQQISGLRHATRIHVTGQPPYPVAMKTEWKHQRHGRLRPGVSSSPTPFRRLQASVF